MTLKQLQRIFKAELAVIYPQTEIDNFFYLLCDAYLNLKRVDIALEPNYIVKDIRFNAALNSLVAQKPIQYIIGKTEFYGLPFTVTKSVLIPRPETEELVAWIVDDHKNKNNLSILDIGTGSGCIAISLTKYLSNARTTAIDISLNALDIAKKNALNNKVSIQFIENDILNSTYTPSEKIDIIVSNPPYVRELEKDKIQKNVLDNEPHIALFVADNNPLLFYEAIAKFALKNLASTGFLYFEINQYLGSETVALLQNLGFKNIQLKKDIYNANRMIRANV